MPHTFIHFFLLVFPDKSECFFFKEFKECGPVIVSDSVEVFNALSELILLSTVFINELLGGYNGVRCNVMWRFRHIGNNPRCRIRILRGVVKSCMRDSAWKLDITKLRIILQLCLTGFEN